MGLEVSAVSLGFGNRRLTLWRRLTVITHSLSTMMVLVTVVILAARAGG